MNWNKFVFHFANRKKFGQLALVVQCWTKSRACGWTIFVLLLQAQLSHVICHVTSCCHVICHVTWLWREHVAWLAVMSCYMIWVVSRFKLACRPISGCGVLLSLLTCLSHPLAVHYSRLCYDLLLPSSSPSLLFSGLWLYYTSPCYAMKSPALM